MSWTGKGENARGDSFHGNAGGPATGGRGRKRRWLPKKFRPNIFLARHWSDSIQAKLRQPDRY